LRIGISKIKSSALPGYKLIEFHVTS
jgi:hypothetical protein